MLVIIITAAALAVYAAIVWAITRAFKRCDDEDLF